MDILFCIEPIEEFKNLCRLILRNFHNDTLDKGENSQLVKQDVMVQARKDLKDILLNCEFDATKLTSILRSKNVDEERLNCFISLFNEEKETLLYSSLIYYNSIHGEPVKEFNWLVKLVLGTSELKTLRYPLLQLILTTVTASGESKNVYDLNKENLVNFINNLESNLNKE